MKQVLLNNVPKLSKHVKQVLLRGSPRKVGDVDVRVLDVIRGRTGKGNLEPLILNLESIQPLHRLKGILITNEIGKTKPIRVATL